MAPFSSTASLLSARRPSWTPSLPPEFSGRRLFNNDLDSQDIFVSQNAERTSDDSGNFYRSLQIDMKSLVGDAVGNMSISPASRDVVLAARRGLYIIDLEAPFEVPRFLPQGGTFNVADVQWNPHHSHAEYIVSTSSEKLLIWNLFLVGKTSIEHILHSKYPVDGPTRSVTDINWALDPDLVVSTGIDSWLWAWDLREPRKPIFGFSAFNAGGTQVKWNRQDPNILASSHAKEVLIWDRRKGSLPVSRIKAHNSKIYGIDWAHNRRHEIVTCSLDKTIKLWDVQALGDEQEPMTTICTTYPVWRARDLPFGQGLLSLPQRGSTELEMWKNGRTVERFAGHNDVVKEFVWRKGGQDGNGFQLITWSKDRTLKFWPIDPETLQKVGHTPVYGGPLEVRGGVDESISFRNPPEGTDCPPALSVPVGHRSILAEVRAPAPPRPTNPVLQPHRGSASRGSLHEKMPSSGKHAPISISTSLPIPVWRGGTMSRGNICGKSTRMDAFTWLSRVTVGQRRESSGDPGSRSGSGNGSRSRLTSRSGQQSSSEHPDRAASYCPRSGSRSMASDEWREVDGSQYLQDEISSVLTKLAACKIKLEKHDLTKKRTCTLGLHGPWGDSSSVFVRVTFTFPRDYPQVRHPHGGTPTVELERNPLISLKGRAFILRRLRNIRERRRPCLEACMRFLLFAHEDEHIGRPVVMDSDSSSEDEVRLPSRKMKDLTVALLRNTKNLAEPRTSQGVFGPNGELICFFRAPPRIVRNPLHDMSVSPANNSRSVETVPRLFQSPALLSDAVRRLAFAASDRELSLVDLRRADDGENILRIMTNLLTFSEQKFRRDSELKPLGDIPSSYSLLPSRSTVFISKTTDIAGADRKVASEYVFESNSLGAACDRNALIANKYGRYDHERVFKTLSSLFQISWKRDSTRDRLLPASSLVYQLVDRIYPELCKTKDIQMLAMMSSLFLQASRSTSLLGLGERAVISDKDDQADGISPSESMSSPTIPVVTASLSSSSSLRGSWSSLFNTGSVRQFMTGTFKDSLINTEVPSGTATVPGGLIPVRKIAQVSRALNPPHTKGYSIPSASSASKSWSNSPSSMKSVSVLLAVHGRPTTVSHMINPKDVVERPVVVFHESTAERTSGETLKPYFFNQCICHVMVYSEMLFGWQLFHKRLELLKSVDYDVHRMFGVHGSESHQYWLGLNQSCPCCNADVRENENTCSSCGNPASIPSCSICRLPVKGLSHSCLHCWHITHIACWQSLHMGTCATGCGCCCV